MCLLRRSRFAAAGVLAPLGVTALRSVRRPDERIIAALPVLFAGHQALEGAVG